MEINYKCSCMKDEAAVAVPNRPEGEDLMKWMDKVGIAVAAHHQLHSPLCVATKTEYIKIPMPENSPHLGGKPNLNS